MTCAHQLVFVRLERDTSGFPPWDQEELWALEDGPGRFVLDGVPMFAQELSHRDTVAAVPEKGQWFVTDVLERGGHSTIQVILLQDGAHDELLTVCASHVASLITLRYLATLLWISLQRQISLAWSEISWPDRSVSGGITGKATSPIAIVGLSKRAQVPCQVF